MKYLHWPVAVLTGLALLLLLTGPALLPDAQAKDTDLQSSYQFLVSDRDTGGGVLYTATAGKLDGRLLPLSFVDSAAYWGEHVCRQPDQVCQVVDVYHPQAYTLLPEKSPAGDLQTERINTHNGSNIYDAATWQIAVMLGHVVNHFPLPVNQDAYGLVSNQNVLLREGYNGNSSHAAAGENRAMTAGSVFLYNKQPVTEGHRAYTFRMLPRNWLATDPFMDSRYAVQITARALPADNPDYHKGKVSWTDWKPITGENAWAFLLGPLQAASVHYRAERPSAFVPFADLAVQNALAVLPTFAAMQSPSGAVYYAPEGTLANQGDQVVDPYGVAVENNFSLYAGLRILSATLENTMAHDPDLQAIEKTAITTALQLSKTIINGGVIGNNRRTAGLLAFFKDLAWQQGEFVQGGRANDPASTTPWQSNLQPRAVDVNTWGIAALGPRQIDQWFGFGASYHNWQQVKHWGGYGIGETLWGVGFSDQDGNGIDADGNFRQGVLSVEWTAGAITMVRTMLAWYQSLQIDSPQYQRAQGFIASLRSDEISMLAALTRLRMDTYATAGFPGTPENFNQLLPMPTRPYVYASKRYRIPFGWYANPIPSTCATAWMIMLANRFNPFAYDGLY